MAALRNTVWSHCPSQLALFYQWAATGKVSLVFPFLRQERQIWNLKNLKMGTKMPTNSRKHTGFWRNMKERPWRVQKGTSSWAFSALLFCVQLVSTAWTTKGCLNFDPVVNLPKGNNIIKPKELVQLSDHQEKCKGKCDNGISTQPR